MLIYFSSDKSGFSRLPQEATHTISQMAGPHYQGQAMMQIISSLENAVPAGALIDEKTIKELLESGQFFLVPYSGAKSPMLRQITTINTSDTGIDPSKSEWQLKILICHIRMV